MSVPKPRIPPIAQTYALQAQQRSPASLRDDREQSLGRPARRLQWDDREDDARRVIRVVENAVGRHAPARVGVERLAGVWVHVEPREIAGGDVEADPVSGAEDERGRVELDGELVRSARLEHRRRGERVAVTGSQDSIADVD